MSFLSLRVGSGKRYYASVFYRFVVSFYLEIMFEQSGSGYVTGPAVLYSDWICRTSQVTIQ